MSDNNKKICDKCGEHIVLLTARDNKVKCWYSFTKSIPVATSTQTNDIIILRAIPPHWLMCGRKEPKISDNYFVDAEWSNIEKELLATLSKDSAKKQQEYIEKWWKR